MTKRTRQVEQVRRGQKLDARNVNRWLGDAIEAATGRQLPGVDGVREPALTINVLNADTEDIQARHAISLDASCETTLPALLDRRAMVARRIINPAGIPAAAIACNYIKAGTTGTAYITGICAARMSTADAGGFMSGGGVILWEEDDLDASGKRWSLVRLGGPPRQMVVQVIGGNLISSLPCIQYAADTIAPAQLYDPEVDTSYLTGLGYGWLMGAGGHAMKKVLIRHNFPANTDPLLAGWTYQVGYSTTLTVASGADAGASMTVYTVTWSA